MAPLLKEHMTYCQHNTIQTTTCRCSSLRLLLLCTMVQGAPQALQACQWCVLGGSYAPERQYPRTLSYGRQARRACTIQLNLRYGTAEHNVSHVAVSLQSSGRYTKRQWLCGALYVQASHVAKSSGSGATCCTGW